MRESSALGLFSSDRSLVASINEAVINAQDDEFDNTAIGNAITSALTQTRAALQILDRHKTEPPAKIVTKPITHEKREDLKKNDIYERLFGANFLRAAYTRKRQARDLETISSSNRPISSCDDQCSETILSSKENLCPSPPPPVAFNDLVFPKTLIMTKADVVVQNMEQTAVGQICPKNGSLPLDSGHRSQSATVLVEASNALRNRTRKMRSSATRCNSFSIGVAAHNRDHAITASSRCERECSPRNTTYSHSMSSPGMDIGEKWPDRICRVLTNDQSMSARLKMFQYFSEVLNSVKQRNNQKLPESLLPRTTELKLESGAWSICKPGKPNGGEDAYFSGVDSFVGVADGVGEWGDYGCCPRQFAFALMEGSCEAALTESFHSNSMNSSDPYKSKASARALNILRAGFQKAKTIDKCFGSSTALIAGLDCAGERLGVACLGDSSCMILRRTPPYFKSMTIAKRTREQQHFFNCPYQLSRLPSPEDLPSLEERGLYKLIRVLTNMKPEMSGDSPEQADLTDITVREGDLIILGTDGLFDNLFDHEIISLASLALSPYEARLFVDGYCDPPEFDNLEIFSPLECARRLTTDWIHKKSAHPLALDPPSLLDTRKSAGFAHCDAEPNVGSPRVKRVDSMEMIEDTPNDNNRGYIHTPAEAVARGIAEAAFYRSLDGRAKSPFAKAARAAGGAASGGKEDDITVVACWVVAQ